MWIVKLNSRNGETDIILIIVQLCTENIRHSKSKQQVEMCKLSQILIIAAIIAAGANS